MKTNLLHVLLVEDSQTDAELTIAELERDDWKVSFDRVEEPEDFTNFLRKNRYDAILCDHKMPMFSSIDALKILHLLNKDIPFILVSGNIGEEEAVEIMRAGAHDYVMKHNLRKLNITIQREIKEAQTRAEKKQIEINLKESEQMLRKQADQLRKALEVRDQFITIASHELKTPLSSIKMQAQFLLRTIDKEDFAALTPTRLTKFAETIDKQTSRMDRLVENMFDISRIQSGQLRLQKEECSICELVDEIIEQLWTGPNTLPGQRPQVIYCENIMVLLDIMRIEQVFSHLLNNAVTYGRGRPVSIDIRKVGEFVQIIVKDQGMGIDPKDLVRIFDRFERAILASDISGMGLGLFITKEIVHAHNGKIWVESEVDKGSTFYVNLKITGD